MCYIILRKFNIFQINTCALVNVRGAHTFNENPLARQSAGAVEVRPSGWQGHCRLVRTVALSTSAKVSAAPPPLRSLTRCAFATTQHHTTPIRASWQR